MATQTRNAQQRAGRIGRFTSYYRPDAVAHSSQGPIGYIGHESTGRIKGFITDVVDSRLAAKDLNNMFGEGIQELARSPDFTRLTVRIVARNDLIDYIRHVEAVVPLGNGLSGYSIVYLGHNSSERALRYNTGYPVSHMSYIQHDIIESSERVRGEDPHALLRDATTTGFIITRAQNIDGREAEYIKLLRVHGYSTPHEVARVVQNNTAIIAELEGRIVGITVGEEATIMLSNGKELRVLEITDSTVLPEYRSNGVYAAISTELLRNLAERPDINVAYAETVIRPETLRVAARQGRHFSTETTVKSPAHDGVTRPGILRHHTTVGPVVESLLVNYVHQKDTQALAAALR